MRTLNSSRTPVTESTRTSLLLPPMTRFPRAFPALESLRFVTLPFHVEGSDITFCPVPTRGPRPSGRGRGGAVQGPVGRSRSAPLWSTEVDDCKGARVVHACGAALIYDKVRHRSLTVAPPLLTPSAHVATPLRLGQHPRHVIPTRLSGLPTPASHPRRCLPDCDASFTCGHLSRRIFHRPTRCGRPSAATSRLRSHADVDMAMGAPSWNPRHGR